MVYLYPKLRIRQKSAKGYLPIWFHVELSSPHPTSHSLSPYLYPSSLSVRICWSKSHVPSYSVALNWLIVEYNFPLLFTDKLHHPIIVLVQKLLLSSKKREVERNPCFQYISSGLHVVSPKGSFYHLHRRPASQTRARRQ